MWTVAVTSTEFADERLASLTVECPANLKGSDDFGLLVALWCGRVHDRIDTEAGPCEFSFGFQIGDIVINPTGGRISSQGRLQIDGGQLKIVESRIDQTKKHGSFGGQLGVSLNRWFGSFAKAEVDLSGKLDRAVSKTEQKDREYIQKFWRVADAGHNFWRVYGIDLNSENVLENRIIGNEPLCHIVPEDNVDSVETLVSFRCDLRNLWFHRDEVRPHRGDAHIDKERAERNRRAVAARVVAVALKRLAREPDTKLSESEVILARQVLVSARASTSPELPT